MTPPAGEGFDEQRAPVARGRRDPQMRDMLDAEDAVGDPESQDPTEYGLIAGDIVMAKVTLAGQTPLGDGWYTYGVQSRVIDGETEEQVFNRVADITNSRVVDLAADAFARVEEIVEGQKDAARNHRIPSTRG